MHSEPSRDTPHYSTTGVQLVAAPGVLPDDALIAPRETDAERLLEDQFTIITSRLRDLLSRLEHGWDSYGAKAPQRHLFIAGLRLVEGLLDPDVPVPQVVPTNRGGVQFEWHVGVRELEIEVVGSDRFEVYFEDETTGEVIEDEVTSRKLGLLSTLVKRLKAAS